MWSISKANLAIKQFLKQDIHKLPYDFRKGKEQILYLHSRVYKRYAYIYIYIFVCRYTHVFFPNAQALITRP